MPSTTRLPGTLGRYALCVGLLAITLIAFPLLALTVPLPRLVGNVLFFWPQYVLAPGGFLDRSNNVIVLRGVAIYAAVPFWLALLAAYVGATRRVAIAWVFAGVVPVVLAVLELMIVPLLALLQLRFVLDGP